MDNSPTNRRGLNWREGERGAEQAPEDLVAASFGVGAA
jgi:hypothetical protein